VPDIRASHKIMPRPPNAFAARPLAGFSRPVKILATGQSERRSFSSGPTLTLRRMVSGVKKLSGDWKYDVVSVG
jgi:hypothetical protein